MRSTIRSTRRERYPIGQVFRDRATVDLDAGYDVTKFLDAVGRRDQRPEHQARPDRQLAREQPGDTSTNSLSDGQHYPRSGGPFGINGGFWYVRAKIKI